MTEAQLALKFIAHFSDFDIYKEVPAGGICDIVVDMGRAKVGIEVKTSLSFDVLYQAYERRPFFHYVYIAVPVKTAIHRAAKLFCEQHGIGVLGYKERPGMYGHSDDAPDKGIITEHIKPRLNRKPLRVMLHEYMKRSEAGSQNNRITSFGYFVESFEETVKRWPGLNPKDIFDKLTYRHYLSLSSFKSCVTGYCRSGVIKNVIFEGGKFYIKPNDKEETKAN